VNRSLATPERSAALGGSALRARQKAFRAAWPSPPGCLWNSHSSTMISTKP